MVPAAAAVISEPIVAPTYTPLDQLKDSKLFRQQCYVDGAWVDADDKATLPVYNPADGAQIVALPFGDSEIELLAPLEAESPIAKFLAKRGPGIHHICYRVPDLDAALTACRTAGYRLIDETPRRGAGGRRIAFVHPKATAGILLELTE